MKETNVEMAKAAITGEYVTQMVHASNVWYWQSQYTVPVPMFITAHQGASPKARLVDVPNDVAARAAILNVSFARVLATTISLLVTTYLVGHKGQTPCKRYCKLDHLTPYSRH